MTKIVLAFIVGFSSVAMASTQIKVGAHWGAHIPNQPLGPNDCLADRVDDPALYPVGFRYLIDNTIPSILAAYTFGADAVTINPRATRDGEVVLFHDHSLDCRTNKGEKARR